MRMLYDCYYIFLFLKGSLIILYWSVVESINLNLALLVLYITKKKGVLEKCQIK